MENNRVKNKSKVWCIESQKKDGGRASAAGGKDQDRKQQTQKKIR